MREKWDVVVVGAGPAGALAAVDLARRGLATLLVERKQLPRDKACGGCLSSRAHSVLHRAGCAEVLNIPSAAPIESLELCSFRRSAKFPMPGGVAVLRAELDDRLARLAQQSGATLLTGATANVLSDVVNGWRRVEISRRGNATTQASARVVLACGGLGSVATLLQCGTRTPASRRSRVGVGGAMERADDDLVPGRVCMAVGRCGYVGRVRLGDGRMTLAAALAPDAMQRWGPAGAIRRVLEECGRTSQLGHENCRLLGTLPLDGHIFPAAGERLLVVGDACGYVEPFTGDGMSMAFEMALAVGPIVEAAQKAWSPEMARDWQTKVRRITTSRRTFCRGISGLCRCNWLFDAALRVVSRMPGIVASHFARVNRLPGDFESAVAWK